MKLAIIGGTGFIGNKITPLLSKKYPTTLVGYEEGLDISNRDSVEKALSTTDADTILLMAAYTDVDGAEKQKADGENSLAWKVNVNGPFNVATSAKKNGKKIIYVSTDMVFGGIDQDWYHEDSTPSPVNFYGITKYEGELRVKDSGNNATILRIAYPYTWESEKKDFVRTFLNFFKEKKAFSSVSDAFYAPTYIDDITTTIDVILEKNLTGIIHGASGEKLSGYEAAIIIAETLGFDKSLVSPTTREEFFKDRAPRSKNTALYNDTLNNLGIKLHTLKDALKEMPRELLTFSG